MSTIHNFDEVLGDTFQATLTFVDSAGAAEDHSGSTWRGQVKTSPDSASSAASMSFNTDNAASGTVVATIAAATTAALTAGTVYYYDIEETTSTSAVVTHLTGRIVWRQDVSRA